MANLIQKGSGKQEEKVIKVELPDGTAGEIPIRDAAARTEIFDANNVPQYTPGYKEGGEVKKYEQGRAIYRATGKNYAPGKEGKLQKQIDDLAKKRESKELNDKNTKSVQNRINRKRKKLFAIQKDKRVKAGTIYEGRDSTEITEITERPIRLVEDKERQESYER